MFKEFESKPITRLAHLVVESDFITVIDESTCTLESVGSAKVVTFKHHEPVKVGDYIVYLNEDDIYHCNAKVFAERNSIDELVVNPVSNGILDYFSYTHLPAKLQEVSKPICELAEEMSVLPDGPEKSAGLRKLLEAKDCFVRAALI